MKRHRLGLVVGKFAPLHHGHLALIDHAARHCEQVVVLSYANPDPPGCPPDRRRHWLTACCPDHRVIVIDGRDAPPNDAPDALHQAHLAHLLQHRLPLRPDAIAASEPWVDACAGVLGRALGHAVTPLCFDVTRSHVPVSASRIRAAPQACLSFLPGPVRADWVPRVALLGGESTGKSTLAAALGAACAWAVVPEYGRELWEARDGQLAEGDLLSIAHEQVRRETASAACGTSKVVVCDTTPLTTLGYALSAHGRADAALEALARRRYHLTVLCADDFPFVQDGTRQGRAFSAWQQAWYREQLTRRGIDWLDARGPVSTRVAAVREALAARFPMPAPTG